MSGMQLKVGSNVADARTGRVHGRVRKVLAAPKRATAEQPEFAGLFVVEQEDGARVECSGDDLVVRFTSQSEKYGRKF